MVHCESDPILLADTLLKVQKKSIETFGLDPLCFVSLPGYTYECDLFGSKQDVEYIRDKKLSSN